MNLVRRYLLHVGLLVSAALPAAAVPSMRIQAPVDGQISYRDRVAVIAEGYPGSPMALSVNGNAADTLIVRPDMKAEFLNVTVPTGPVSLAITQERPGGDTLADTVHIHVVGAAARLLLDTSRAALPADSLSQAEVRIRVMDAWGIPLEDGHVVTAHLDRGTILSPDIYPEQDGVQVQVRQGDAELRILSPGTVGKGRLRVSTGPVSATVDLRFVLPEQEWTVVGLATGQVGHRQSDQPPPGVDPGAEFDRGMYGDGRISFYARGSVLGGALLTGAYDSDRHHEDRVFRYLTPERVYPIYGDASSIFYEAPSASKLFVRLEGSHSYAQYGDFATALSAPELSAYRRSFTGISTRLEGDRGTAQLFGAMTEQTIQVDEIAGEGVSGLYYLSAGRRGLVVVEGSERVVIQTRDRLHREVVLGEERQFRFSDYEIDYEAGTLLFKRPVPSYKGDENPVVIVATYETAQVLKKRVVAGGRMAYRSEDQGEVGVTVVAEERAGRNYWLTGVDSRWRPGEGIDVLAELARTRAANPGWAWKIGARGQVLPGLSCDAYYREAQRDFVNTSVTTVRAGARKMRGRINWSGWNRTRLVVEAFQDDDKVNGQTRTSGKVAGSYSRGSLTQEYAVEATESETRSRNLRSTILSAGLAWQACPDLSLEAERDQAFGDEDVLYRPTLNRVRARWRMKENLDLVGEHSFRSLSLVDSSLTTLGLQSRVSDLTAYANYRLDNGVNGMTNQAIVGLRHRQRLRDDMTVHGGFERVSTLHGPGQDDFWAVTLGSEYLPTAPMKASARLENREGESLDKTVASLAADLTVGQGLSWLGRHTYLREKRRAGETHEHHLSTGMAYRPLHHDHVNALAKYEYRRRENTLATPHVDRWMHLGSVEALLEPWPRMEWFGRYAFKIASLASGGRTDQTLTDLWMTNLRLEWRARWDVLAEYRLLTQHTADDYQHGAALEIGHVLRRNARLAVGYNFAGYQDDDLSGVSYWARGPYMKMALKCTESDVAGWLDGLQSRWPGGS